jgi:hypothetical protein
MCVFRVKNVKEKVTISPTVLNFDNIERCLFEILRKKHQINNNIYQLFDDKETRDRRLCYLKKKKTPNQ